MSLNLASETAAALMADAARAADDSNRKHPSLQVLCARLERIMHGHAAQALLTAGDLPERAGVVTLPAWSWDHPLIDVGRKDKAHGTGERMLMPVRNNWDTPMVVLVADESVPVSYSTRGMGHATAGQSKLVRRPGLAPVTAVDSMPSLAEPVFVGAGTTSRIGAQLNKLVVDGKAAHWEVVQGLEPKLRTAVYQAHASVSYEIGNSTGVVEPMLDELGLEQIVDTMMYGELQDEDETAERVKDKPSAIFRLIELCLGPECFLRVDPLKYMTKHMRRDAEAQIRRKIGDPHIGPKVREIARRHPRAEIADIVAAYREVYPKDRLSLPRARAALSVSPSASARSTLLVPDSFNSQAIYEGSQAA
ncbi:hypothetical protein Achl_4393 (plasmid) [Pseudarthrobacter chlorophenolicus A6]|uniref:Uncharacterized protein n=1 Tax=Pseudarthrobacter chlorophenolicus (strain ATCC 700700 / DSM 12829 / CIP 107037 / JCM 12360 / KCTC 9906 / NCIMB 13794 / A6) TaxID=452863 RepID=B8HIU7_PSECP|nr:hypothetical protein [Pseudarthrobacter chlorophenolicus]ACL42344.1 hypothetical protein Achl_4393 [Pseudarthrobacter chlorophenolicus A6]SDQ16769.1 hypothetical protein SAMN04489738_0450 [Pseudarthrobacter chlorophenolicus]